MNSLNIAENAINSFLLVAVFTAIGADMYLRYAWYDPLISVFPWFFRYYSGGYKNAKEIAFHKRTEKRNNKLNELIMLIKNDSISGCNWAIRIIPNFSKIFI